MHRIGRGLTGTGTHSKPVLFMSQDAQQQCQAVLGECASYQLRRIARLTTNAFNETLKPTGLRSTQAAVLLGAGANPDQSISGLAEKLSLDVSTLQRSLTVLQKQGYIALKKGHQREKKVRLTPEGLNKIREAKPYWEKAQNRFLESFGHTQWRDFLASAQDFCDKS